MTTDPNAALHYVDQVSRTDIYTPEHARAMRGRTCSFTFRGTPCLTPARYMFVDDCHPATPYEPVCRQHLNFRDAQLDPAARHVLLPYQIDPSDTDLNDTFSDVPVPHGPEDVAP